MNNLLVVRNPMDFSIIQTRLHLHGFLDPEDVYKKVTNLFICNKTGMCVTCVS